MVREKSARYIDSTPYAVVMFTMVLLGCGPRTDIASLGATDIQHRQETTFSMSVDEVRRLNAEVVRLNNAGSYDKAILLAQRVLKIGEQALGPAHPEVVASLNNLAALYATTGDYAKAEPLYQRALQIAEQALGPTHPQVALALNNLA